MYWGHVGGSSDVRVIIVINVGLAIPDEGVDGGRIELVVTHDSFC